MTSERRGPMFEADAARIRDAYSRRSHQGLGGRYSMINPSVAQRVHERERRFLSGLARLGMANLGDIDALEVGCGTGGELARLVALGFDPERLHAVDLRGDAVVEARRRVKANILEADASSLPYEDAAFDLVIQLTALSSMPSLPMRERVGSEMWRVLRDGGVLVSYDFVANPRNPDTVGIGRAELTALFPEARFRFERITLAPPISNALGRIHPRLITLVGAVPFLRSHLLAFARKPA